MTPTTADRAADDPAEDRHADPGDARASARADERADGWVDGVGRAESPNQDARPEGTVVTLAIVHSISLPPGVYGGDAIERLFQNRLDWDAHPYFDAIRGLRVSAHFLIRRDGERLQFVDTDRRAWHAGVSSWRGRPRCNDYSVGIELEGLEGESFEAVQTEALAALLQALRRRHPIDAVVGHEHVAPGRKHDPGARFDWAGLRRRLHPWTPDFPEVSLSDDTRPNRSASL